MADETSSPTIRIMFETSPIGMCSVLVDGAILRANGAYRSLAGEGASLFGAFVADFHEALRLGMIAVCEGAQPNFGLVARLAGDPDRWCEVSMVRMRGASGDLMVHVLDVTSRQRHETALRERADTDPLTGLYNRAAFESIVRDRLLQRPHGVVLLVDLDGFKAVNDTHGHKIGDELLTAVAEKIRTSVRNTDVVARLGGDEFVVWLEGQIPEPGKIANALISRLVSTAAGVVRAPQVSASIGICRAGDGSTVEQLLHAADQAMYTAKRAGKGRAAEHIPKR
jgi:diguanylate cyclase (GGDEF)-like protein